ncbi:MAG: hypothetical protein KDE32_14305 [Novosphingobium sp.]|nr:hypothetical protein [Novosphingobium sp.]
MPFSHVITEETEKPLEDIYSVAPPGSIHKLAALRRKSLPQLKQVISRIESETGLPSEFNEKRNRVAKSKTERPVTLERYPWMTLAHLRDYLRFRTRLRSLANFIDVFTVFAKLQEEGRISIVKVDTAKLLSPGEFGWRMIATDIRLDSGLLVEHYMTFGDLIAMNEDWLHKVYERWRDKVVTNFGDARSRRRDAEFSCAGYREVFVERVLGSVADGSPVASPRELSRKELVRVVTEHLDL